MKRYILYNDGSPIREQEAPDGDWVRWADCKEELPNGSMLETFQVVFMGLKIAACVWIIAACAKYILY